MNESTFVLILISQALLTRCRNVTMIRLYEDVSFEDEWCLHALFSDEKHFLSSEFLQEVRSRMTKTIEIFNLPIAISCSLLRPADGAFHVQSAPGSDFMAENLIFHLQLHIICLKNKSSGICYELMHRAAYRSGDVLPITTG